jgi:hypothetical protein
MSVARAAAAEARAARGEVEAALDAAGWPYLFRLSRWLDLLLVIGESA